MRVLVCMLSIVSIAVNCASLANADEPTDPNVRRWDRFLVDPTPANLAEIAQAVASCKRDSECRAGAAPSSNQVIRLIRLVDAGNPIAVEAGFVASTAMFFMGGNYEDVVITLGEVSERDPKLFLAMVAHYGENQDLLVMLPRETVDDFPSQRRVVERRRAKVASVSSPELKATRSWAIDVLDRASAALADR